SSRSSRYHPQRAIRLREQSGAVGLHHDVVLDADAAPALHVDAGLDGAHHARFERRVGSRVEARIFMRLQPEPVAGAVDEVIAAVIMLATSSSDWPTRIARTTSSYV